MLRVKVLSHYRCSVLLYYVIVGYAEMRCLLSRNLEIRMDVSCQKFLLKQSVILFRPRRYLSVDLAKI
jgi:hypothetical protein